MNQQTKTCSKCEQTKSVSEFYKQKSGIHKCTPRCKACINTYSQRRYQKLKPKRQKQNADWRARNPERMHELHIARMYGMTPAAFHQMRTLQNNSCAICFADEKSLPRRLCVDHCHTTGRVRGLLCANCNTAIGKLKDNAEVMLRAAAYVQTR